MSFKIVKPKIESWCFYLLGIKHETHEEANLLVFLKVKKIVTYIEKIHNKSHDT